MVNSDDWVEYKQLIMSRLDDIAELEKDIIDLKIKLAVLTTKILLLTGGVAMVISGLVTGLINHFLSKGV
jgi:hypothetical protein